MASPTVENRRVEVASLLLAGRTQRQMAEMLGVGKGTISRDVVAIRAEWQGRRLELLDSVGAEDLARTDAAIAAIWDEVLNGKLPAVDRLVSLLQYRARVLGLEAVQRQELDIGDVLAGILERLTAASGPADNNG